MSITVNSGSTTVDRPVYEDGEVYFARVVQIVDLGLQEGDEYQGNKKPDSEQVMFTFEFPDVLNGEGKPGWLSMIVTLPQRWEEGGSFKGIHVKSNLYKLFNIVYPEGLFKGKNPSYYSFSYNFNWEDILNKPVQVGVTVTDEGKTYLNKSTLGRVPAKFINSVGKLANTPRVINMDTVTPEDWDSLFGWVKTKIKASLDPNVVEKAEKMDALTSKKELPEDSEKPPINKKPKVTKRSDDPDFNDDIPF